MTTSDARAQDGGTAGRQAGVNYVELTFALMGGALAWLLRLIANSSLVEYSCQIDATWPLWLITVAATLIGVAALVSSRKYSRMADDVAHAATARWLGVLGIMFNVTAIAGILLETAPTVVLDICLAVPG
jgi:hypothetical protein